MQEAPGWTFPWLSSLDNDFNDDFRVTLEEADAAETNAELPGLSVFFRDGTQVFLTYSTYLRRLDVLLGTYESPVPTFRRHDRFPPQQARR